MDANKAVCAFLGADGWMDGHIARFGMDILGSCVKGASWRTGWTGLGCPGLGGIERNSSRVELNTNINNTITCRREER